MRSPLRCSRSRRSSDGLAAEKERGGRVPEDGLVGRSAAWSRTGAGRSVLRGPPRLTAWRLAPVVHPCGTEAGEHFPDHQTLEQLSLISVAQDIPTPMVGREGEPAAASAVATVRGLCKASRRRLIGADVPARAAAIAVDVVEEERAQVGAAGAH